MDRAETVRLARRVQIQTRKQYEEARDKELSDEQSPEQSQRVKELQEAADAADAEMARLRPEKPRSDVDTGEEYVPPIASEWSN